VYPVAFGPRVDKERTSPFLPDDPEKLITLGQFNNVPLIAGLTESEGGLFGASKNIYGLKLLQHFLLQDLLNLISHSSFGIISWIQSESV
jgi:carboxylesterase type B